MTDPRPRPEYGEYATPEQQAAAMGRAYVPPPRPETRVSVPAAAPDQKTTAASMHLGGNLIDRFVTIFQLGIGLLFLLSSDYFHSGEIVNTAMAEFGLAQRIPVTIDQYAWLLLGTNIVVLLATFVWAFATLRRGRLAFYIPVVGYLVYAIALGIVLFVLR